MDVAEIKKIVNSSIPDVVKEDEILNVLIKDERLVPLLLRMIDRERTNKKELITDMNLELSRAHIYIDMRPETKVEGQDCFNKGFVLDEIAKFYLRYKGSITHCFNRFK